MKSCKICNTSLATKRSDAVFCSNKCYCIYYKNKHAIKTKKYKTDYYQINKEKINIISKSRYNLKHRVKHNEIDCANCKTPFMPKHSAAKCCSKKCSNQLWKTNNKQHINQWHKNHYNNNLNRRLSTCIRSRINKALKRSHKYYSTTKYIGCSPCDLVKHLESKFVSGMSWNNYGKGPNKWNIDHIIPLASFDLSIREQFAAACSYINLQPLWEKDNIAKGSRLL